MAVMSRIKELGRVFTESDDNEINIDENNISDESIKEIIMIDPRAMELLKAFASLKKGEKEVERGISDTDTSSKKNRLGKYKADSEVNPKRSLEAMTEILERGNKTRERADD